MSKDANQESAAPNPKVVAHRFLIQGHVQGVFFREWTVSKAREMGVSGWVRNLRDGRVEVYAIGDQSMLDQFAMHLHKGSPASIVENVQSDEAEIEAINGFTRRQTS